MCYLMELTVDGEPININTEFAGNYGVWKKLFAFAIKENYSSLFKAGRANGLQDVNGSGKSE